jgi:hypothetical protein
MWQCGKSAAVVKLNCWILHNSVIKQAVKYRTFRAFGGELRSPDGAKRRRIRPAGESPNARVATGW